MSVTSKTTSCSYQYAPGTTYSIPYQYKEPSDVKAYYVISGGKKTNLSYGTDYTVNDTNANVSKAIPIGATITFYRKTVVEQQTVLPKQTITKAIEEAIDRNTMCIQEVDYDVTDLSEGFKEFTDTVEETVENLKQSFNEKVIAVEAAKTIAVSASESALASKSAAATSQSSAASSAETAQASAESASSSAASALASKNAALTSENNAKASETNSAKSEANAKAAETTAENSKQSASEYASAASNSADSALESKTSAAASAESASLSKTSAESNANAAASSATTATEQANRAQSIADNLESLAGLIGIATTEEAIAGVVDNKAMTPLKTKEAVSEIIQVPLQGKADLVSGKVPTNQLPEMDYVPNSGVGNEANKIPKYNADGHLVFPSGGQLWVD